MGVGACSLEYAIICLTAFFASLLTLFSGFGLGTVLMPVFAIFFPLPISIAATALIHLANNIFKLGIVGKFAEKKAVLKFGLSAAIASAIGAYLLGYFASIPPLFSYTISSYQFDVTIIGLVIGLIIITASFFELVPQLTHLSFDQKYLIPGGLLSGFFGGLSGYQGILRSAFLIKSGLNKEQFIGTGVVCSVIVDVVRIIVYGWSAYSIKFMHISQDMIGIIVAASIAAFIGAYLGAKWIKKITFKTVQVIVGIMLVLIGIAMCIGLTQTA